MGLEKAMTRKLMSFIDRVWSKVRPLLVFASTLGVLFLWLDLMGHAVHVIETLLGVAISLGAGAYLHFKLPKSIFDTEIEANS